MCRHPKTCERIVRETLTRLEASLSDPSGVFLFVGFHWCPCASSPDVTPAVWGQMVTSYATGVCRDRPYQRHASGIKKGWQLSATSKGHFEWSILWKNVGPSSSKICLSIWGASSEIRWKTPKNCKPQSSILWPLIRFGIGLILNRKFHPDTDELSIHVRWFHQRHVGSGPRGLSFNCSILLQTTSY